MRLPFEVMSDLPESAEAKWQRQFVAIGRSRHEGIWRRTQEPATKKYSGYQSAADGRWKLLHFYDDYALIKADGGWSLAIDKPYLWLNTALPRDEMTHYWQRIINAINTGGWKVTHDEKGGLTATRGDLIAQARWMPLTEAERQAVRKLPADYKILDIEIYGPTQHLSDEERQRPWNVLRTGIRKALAPGNPTIFDVEDGFDISKYVPFHLELGCGPSVEAGVPPLSFLHKTYAISNPKTHDFLLGDHDDVLDRLLADPEGFYRQASLIYSSSLRAQPTTEFYETIARLYRDGTILAPVFTNNYDGLVADIGMNEQYMRKFDDAHLFPDVEFDHRAKALVVVGSHADRRKLQEKARTSGLQVIYVDPERYQDESSDSSYSYNIEAPQDDDILLRMTAKTFAKTVLRNI